MQKVFISQFTFFQQPVLCHRLFRSVGLHRKRYTSNYGPKLIWASLGLGPIRTTIFVRNLRWPRNFEESGVVAGCCSQSSPMDKKKTALPPKRRKIESKAQAQWNLPNLSQATIDKGKTSLHNTPIHTEPVGVKDLKIQQAKKFAVAQAQQEGWLGNFRSFDSSFGNYLVPTIPTHADLFGRTGPLKNSRGKD